MLWHEMFLKKIFKYLAPYLKGSHSPWGFPISHCFSCIIYCNTKWRFLPIWKRAYFIKQTRTRTSILRKSGTQTLRKSAPTQKFTVWAKNSLLSNLMVLVSNMTIVFQNFNQKYPTKALLLPNLCIFILQKILHLD